jgi:hypothetical protein
MAPRRSVFLLRGRSQSEINYAALFRRRCIRDVASAVTPHANVGLLGMTGEAFKHAEPRADFPDLRRRLIGENTLVRDAL